ncbi:Rpn family recombination-promoting nuclease/putative transposase, partial [Treponema primitia]|uniref:PD-(D/E)XK nuclease family transposase n=1 Tax=Treponema primitia TaxID=88058 RepID=UPI00397FDAC9
YSIRNSQSGAEFTDLIAINVLELGKLPQESDGGRLFNWGQFFKAQNPEEMAMVAEKDPAIKQAVALVMELNDDERTRQAGNGKAIGKAKTRLLSLWSKAILWNR